MREEMGDLFTYPADCIVVPVNWRTKRNGDAVMGAGVAKQAAERWPWLPGNLGKRIYATPDTPDLWWIGTVGIDVVAFPTKGDWREPADLGLIKLGALDLVVMTERHGWQAIALPRLGCGERTGRLDWETQVRPMLAGILDDRFIVLRPEGGHL